tara:strand:- start:201 stop:644 length:444 start_codon:yes stop_codon:yes gene_type:complete
MLNLISKNIFFFLCKILYIPLLASIFSYSIGCIFFETTKISCLKASQMAYKHFKSLFNKISVFEKNTIIILINLYKILILYYVTKYIKPNINFETLIGCILLIIYFSIFPYDETYLNKKLNHNKKILLTMIITISIFINYILYKLVK